MAPFRICGVNLHRATTPTAWVRDRWYQNQLFADIQSSGLYFLLIHCESREISGCHREAFIYQLLVFGNDFNLNNFQNRATILPHDISFFFCCSCTASHQSSNLPKRVEQNKSPLHAFSACGLAQVMEK